MIALKKNWAGLVNFVVEFAAGGFSALDIVVNFDVVKSQGDFVSDDGCFGGLPLVARFRNEFVGRFEVIDGAIAIDCIGAASVIAQDLNLVPSAEVKAAVGFIGDHKFEFNGEVPELVVGNEV